MPPLSANSPPIAVVAQHDAREAPGYSAIMPNQSSGQTALSPLDPSRSGASRNSTEGDGKKAATRSTSTYKISEQARRRSRSLIVAAAWLIIAVVLLSRLALQHAILARLLNRCTPLAGEEWACTAAEAAGRLGLVRPVRLVTHVAATTPATAGTWRPTILLPSDANRWTFRQQDSIPVEATLT